MGPEELIHDVYGEIVPLPAQFHDDLTLNLPGMQTHLEFLLSHGVKNIYLALAASEFEYMTLQERLSVTEMAGKIVDGQAKILAQPVGGRWFDEQVEEAAAMVDLGADVLVVKLMDLKEDQKFFSSRYRKCGYVSEYHDDFFIECLEHIGSASGGYIILHDKPFRSFEFLSKVVALDRVVGIKTHEEEPWRRHEIYSRFGNDLICFDGMGKTNQLWSLIWGARARHTCWSWFDPRTDQEFTRFVKQGEIGEAVKIVNREWPIVNAILSTGFHGYKTIMGFLGLPTGPVRAPGGIISNDEKELIREALVSTGYIRY